MSTVPVNIPNMLLQCLSCLLCLYHACYACNIPTRPLVCLSYACNMLTCLYFVCTMDTMPVLFLLCLFITYNAYIMPTICILRLLCVNFDNSFFFSQNDN